MLTTYQPNLLITSDYQIAKQFLLNEDQQVTKKTFSEILETIDHSDPRILISPKKNNQYFESFDYNVGYDQNEIFSINVNFVDVNYDFESLFLKFIFSEEDFRNKVKEYVDKRSTADLKSIVNFGETTIGNLTNEYLQSINDKFSFNRTFYFVFGINNTYNSVIASNYIYSEVSQSSEGFKKLKVNFQNTGNPLVLSNLNKLQINKSSLTSILSDSSYKVYSLYNYEDRVDLIKIVKEKKLDKFLKRIIKKIFSKITRREIIILLPDFDRLYQNFKDSNSKSSRTRALITPSLQVNPDAKLLETFSNAKEYFTIVEFLNRLGMTIETDLYKSLQNFESTVPQEILKKLEDFKNNETIKDLIKRNTLGVSSLGETETIRQEFLKNLIGYYVYRTPKYKDFLDPDGTILNPNTNAEKRLEEIIELLKKRENINTVDGLVEKIISIELNDLFSNIGLTPAKKSEELDLSEKFQEKFTNTKISFVIINKTDGTSYDTENVAPQIKGFINFESFISQFSNKLSYLWGGFPFKIGFFEENDLKRLEILHETAKDTYEDLYVTLPLVRDVTNGAIVIADDFLLRNLYLPVTKVEDKIIIRNFPVSNDDMYNFGEDSAYQEILRKRKKDLKKYINSSFNESLNTDILDYAMSQDTDNSNNFVFPVFVANDSRSNVLSYSLEIDKLTHTTSYSQFIELIKKQIITEFVSNKAVSIYGRFLNYEEIKKDLQGFINSKTNKDLNEEFSKIISNIENGFEPYYTFGSIEPELATEQIDESSKIAEELVNHLYLQILTELSQQSDKNNATYKVVTDIKFNPLLKKKQLLRELYQKMFRVSIKTLPFFNFNSIEKLYSGAFLIIKNITNPSFGVGDTYNFLTGIYLIQSFRHVMNPTSCYSEFILVKDVDIGGVEG